MAAELVLNRAELVIDLELKLAYDPSAGRLYRTDPEGAPIRELTLWRWDESEGRGRIKIGTIQVGTKHKMMTHVIHYMTAGKWPAPGMYIDHANRDPRDNRAANLREVTPTQNAMNTDRGGKYWRGRDELLEQGVTLTPHGTYQVKVMGFHIGTFKSRIAANEECRKARRALKGAYDIPARTWRRFVRL